MNVEKETDEYKILELERLADNASNLGNYVQLVEYLEQLCEYDFTVRNVYRLLQVYLDTRNSTKKKALAKKLPLLPVRNDEVRLLLSFYMICGEYNGAFDVLNKWLSMYPTDIQMRKTALSMYFTSHSPNYHKTEDKWLEILCESAKYLIDNGEAANIYMELNWLYMEWYDHETAHEYLMKYINSQQVDTANYIKGLEELHSTAVYSGLLSDDEYVRLIDKLYAYSKPDEEHTAFNVPGRCHKKLRVGIISSDFYNHPAGKFFCSLFLYPIDNTGIETYCYYTTPDIWDSYTDVVKENADVFKSVSVYSDIQLGRILLEDQLDILVDLNGTSSGKKLSLLAQRFAPVQMSWIGYLSTTCTHNIDYMIGDPFLDPPDGRTERFLTEKVLRMKPCYLCGAMFHVKSKPADEPPCVRNGYITFGNLSNPRKMSARTLLQWKMTLDKVPGSKLLLRFPISDKFYLDRIKERLSRHGINISRVVFTHKPGQEGYFDTYNDVDILLDTTPFSGWTTTTESFFMGMPTITYKSDYRQGRGYTLLEQVDMGDLAASSDEEFAQKACDLANDVERIRHIKKTLPQSLKDSPLFNARIFRQAFENIVEQAYVQYCYEHNHI
jgi:hypothetical protein